MAVYVDSLQNHAKIPGANSWWCHCWADDLHELQVMARAIGLKPSWIQVRKTQPIYHYDLSASKRQLAIEHGAVEKYAGEWMQEQKEKQS